MQINIRIEFDNISSPYDFSIFHHGMQYVDTKKIEISIGAGTLWGYPIHSVFFTFVEFVFSIFPFSVSSCIFENKIITRNDEYMEQEVTKISIEFFFSTDIHINIIN